MFYIYMNDEVSSCPMEREHALTTLKTFKRLYPDKDWSLVEIDSDDMNAIFLLQDLKASLEDYTLDWSDLDARTCDIYVDLLDKVIEVMVDHYNKNKGA